MKKLIAIVIIAIIAISGFGYYKYIYTTNKPIDPVKTLISNYYFDNGEYETYSSLFLKKDEVVTKETYKSFREKNTVDKIFGRDIPLNDVYNNLKVVKINGSEYEVKWNEDNKKLTWVVEKNKNVWYLKN